MQILLGLRIAKDPLKGKTATEYAHGLLSEMLKEAGLSLPSPLPLAKDENGRPYLDLKQYQGKLDFNLSHAGRYAACAVAITERDGEAPRVGVDLEVPHPHIAAEGIAERFFSEKEIALLKKCAFDESAFLDIWTKKEAYLKFLGTGLSGGMKTADTASETELDPPARLISYPISTDPTAHLTLCLPIGVTPPENVKIFGEV